MGLGSGASLQGWRGSYEVWVPANWLLEQAMKLAWRGLAGWIRWLVRVPMGGPSLVGVGGWWWWMLFMIYWSG